MCALRRCLLKEKFLSIAILFLGGSFASAQGFGGCDLNQALGQPCVRVDSCSVGGTDYILVTATNAGSRNAFVIDAGRCEVAYGPDYLTGAKQQLASSCAQGGGSGYGGIGGGGGGGGVCTDGFEYLGQVICCSHPNGLDEIMLCQTFLSE